MVDEHGDGRIRGPRVGGIGEGDLALPFGVEQIGPRLGALILGEHLGVLQDHQQVQIVADPEVGRLTVFGGRRVVVLRQIRGEVLLVGLQQRPADAPDDVAARPVLLRLDALDDDARAGGYGLDSDAGLLREGGEYQLVQRVVIRRVDDDLLLRLDLGAEAQACERQQRKAKRAKWSNFHDPLPISARIATRLVRPNPSHGIIMNDASASLNFGLEQPMRPRRPIRALSGCQAPPGRPRDVAGRSECPRPRSSPWCRCGSLCRRACCAHPR